MMALAAKIYCMFENISRAIIQSVVTDGFMIHSLSPKYTLQYQETCTDES